MIRHVVLLRWNEDASEEAVAAVTDGLAGLPDAIEQIRTYRYGPDAGISEGNWHYAIVADFDDVAAYEVYRDHDAHQRLIAERIRPIVAERAAAQYVVVG